MRVSSILAASAALSIMAVPATAAAPGNPAAKLSLTSATSAAAQDEGKSFAGNEYWFIGIGVLAVILLAIAMGGDNGKDDEEPASA